MNRNLARRSVLVALATLFTFCSPVLAATIVADQTTCTLVDAIMAANDDAPVGGCSAGSGTDTIELMANVVLTTGPHGSTNCPRGLPVIDTPMTIEGNGFTIERAAAAAHFGLIDVRFANVVLNDLVLRDGRYSTTSVPCVGAGISNFAGSLTVSNSTLSNNVTNSRGGAIHTQFGQLRVENSTIADNSGVLGSAILMRDAGTVTVENSTISGNESAMPGGSAIHSFFNDGLTLRNNTVMGNSVRGLSNSCCPGTDLTISGTIFADNANNCQGTILDGGGNFSDDGSCPSGFDDIQPGVDVDLTLGQNGGPTETHALLPGSVAIDAAGDCGLATDQRGVPRDDNACDSGSFEDELCGDGVLDDGEECDDGNEVDGDGCDSNCTLTRCGNRVVTEGEECDDGNNEDGDGCAADCTLEAVPAVSLGGLLALVLVLLGISSTVLRSKRR